MPRKKRKAGGMDRPGLERGKNYSRRNFYWRTTERGEGGGKHI